MNAGRGLFILLYLLTATLFIGCQPIRWASTPAEAVLQRAKRAMGPQSFVYQETIHHRQTLEIAGKSFVLLTFDRQYEARQEPCLAVYETRKNTIGVWVTGFGDVSCQAQPMESQADKPLDVNGALDFGSGPGETALSYAAGLVRQKEIKEVEVTWADGKILTVDVIDESYLAAIPSSLRIVTVKGLGENGEVLYTFNAK